MSYHQRLTKIENKRNQITKEEKALEEERKSLVRKYDTRRKIFCGAIFLKKMYEDQDPELIAVFRDALKKAPQKTQDEFPEFFEKPNFVLGENVQIQNKNKNFLAETIEN